MTAKIRKILFREVRDTLGFYPNWPTNDNIELGLIGQHFSREASFEWKTSLSNLGISFHTLTSSTSTDRLDTSASGVNYEFSSNLTDKHASAEFEFTKGRSFATQGFNMYYKRINTGDLERDLLPLINGKHVQWDKEWVILTELFEANSFTTLVSESKKARAVIAASVPILANTFNIADPNLGLKVTESSNMAHREIATMSVKPYFVIHKAIWFDGSYRRLKQYGILGYKQLRRA
jgi:hypothetical protein